MGIPFLGLPAGECLPEKTNGPATSLTAEIRFPVDARGAWSHRRKTSGLSPLWSVQGKNIKCSFKDA